MTQCTLEIYLESEATFSQGGGLPGLLDVEIQHDALGLPTISGRSIKGLLVNECSILLNVLPADPWQPAALRLFGMRGEQEDQPGGLWVGDAGIAPDLAARLQQDAIKRKAPDPQQVLSALSSLRTQTAMSETGAPRDETLRTVRVLNHSLTLYAPVHLADGVKPADQALLAACVKALRRAGLGRGRGKGNLKVSLTDRPLQPAAFATTTTVQDLTESWFQPMREALQ